MIFRYLFICVLFYVASIKSQENASERSFLASEENQMSHASSDIWNLFPEIPTSAEKREEFSLRPLSKPVKLTGEDHEISVLFEKRDQSKDVSHQKGSLKVLRKRPVGKVKDVDHIAVSFSAPMIELTDHAQSISGAVPIEISPKLKGKWRWVGTQTVLFTPDEKVPGSTLFKLRIPKSTKSVHHQKIEGEKAWSFETSRVELIDYYPKRGPQELSSKMALILNQKIDESKIKNSIEVKANGQVWPFKLLGVNKVKDDEMKRFLQRYEDQSLLLLKPTRNFPKDAKIQVTLKKGAPSAEGPLKTQESQSFEFKTFEKLKLTQSRCGWSRECRPGMPWALNFNNPLNADMDVEKMIEVSPKPSQIDYSVARNSIAIRAVSDPETRYKVTIKKDLEDSFGQTLEREKSVSFDVGQAHPALYLPGNPLVTLDPRAKGKLAYYALNVPEVDIEIREVKISDWEAFSRSRSSRDRQLPGHIVHHESISLRKYQNKLKQHHYDLSSWLSSETKGHLIVSLKTTGGLLSQGRGQNRDFEISTWVQATDLGLNIVADHSEVLTWLTSLRDAEVIEGAEISVGHQKQKTNQQGLASFSASSSEGAPIIAKYNGDSAFITIAHFHLKNANWSTGNNEDDYIWYVFDDRHMYRPGEEVHIKGILRYWEKGQKGQLRKVSTENAKVRWTVSDSRRQEVVKGESKLLTHGSFDFRFDLPSEVNLGNAHIRIELIDNKLDRNIQYRHTFQIQEFRRPEFEVEVKMDAGPYFQQEKLRPMVLAKYYTGAPLANAPVRWNIRKTQTSFNPPNHRDFIFGVWNPWWWGPRGRHLQAKAEVYQGETNSQGEAVLSLDLGEFRPAYPKHLDIEASVEDVNYQKWSGRSQVLVHPADVYVGVRPEKYFFSQDETISLDLLAVDIDGERRSDKSILVEFYRLDHRVSLESKDKEEKLDLETCEVTSENEPVECQFQVQRGGQHRVTAIIKDQRGRSNQTQLDLWIAGGTRQTDHQSQLQEINLIPKHDEFAPGDKVEVLAEIPFEKGTGLLSIRRQGLVTQETFKITEGQAVLSLDLDEADIPGVHLFVEAVAGAPLLSQASGSIYLPIATKTRELEVDLKLEKEEFSPGEEVQVQVEVLTYDGQPAKDAEVTLYVVDEAVLALSDYSLSDPFDIFYKKRPHQTHNHRSRNSLVLLDIEDDELKTSMLQGGEAMAEESLGMTATLSRSAVMESDASVASEAPTTPLDLRHDFSALAVFLPDLITDQYGQVDVNFSLPDSLTRYRVIAVVHDGGDRFGVKEANLTARLPLMVRPSSPRFLNFGDEFEWPVVLHNQTDKNLEVELAVRGSNIKWRGPVSQMVSVNPFDRVEVRFPAKATAAGKAVLHAIGRSASFVDGVANEFPVWTPATTEAFATYGSLSDEMKAYRVVAPEEVYPQFGGLEISFSTTQLHALADAFLYLIEYPYRHSSHVASRVMAIAALEDILRDFEIDQMPSSDEVKTIVKRDIQFLVDEQNRDGGWGNWAGRGSSWPFISAHVTQALVYAQKRDINVSPETMDRAFRYLKNIRAHASSYTSAQSRLALSVFAEKILVEAGKKREREVSNLAREVLNEEVSPEVLGWLLYALSQGEKSKYKEEVLRQLNNMTYETAATAQFEGDYGDLNYRFLFSSRRSDAIVLDGLLHSQNQSDLVEKVVRGLLSHRRRGRWMNTQENSYILMALRHYYDLYEKETPSLKAMSSLGNYLLGELEFKGREVDRFHLNIPMDFLSNVAAKGEDLVLNREGEGRLYYRAGMRYALKDLKTAQSEHGFSVTRTYEAVDDEKDVQQKSDGSWRVRRGATVKVTLSMASDARRYHVALVDPLAAGFETLNPALAVSPQVDTDERDVSHHPYQLRWFRSWYEHQQMRDERVEAFTSLLRGGVYQYSYYVRATTPGKFIVPPAKAEEMYHPETFGRSSSDIVVIDSF